MAIEFSNLINPNELTTSLAITIMGLLGIISFLGYRLRSPVVFFFLMLNIMVLILSFITNLDFIWFWIMIFVSFVVIAITSIVFYVFD